MQNKKTCPNGHVYDPSIYGDQCPLCPPGMTSPAGSGPATHLAGAPAGGNAGGGMHTHIAGAAPAGFGAPMGGNAMGKMGVGQADPTPAPQNCVRRMQLLAAAVIR